MKLLNATIIIMLTSLTAYADEPVDITRETIGLYTRCVNDDIRSIIDTRPITKDDIREFDLICYDLMQNTPTFRAQELQFQSALRQETLKQRNILLNKAK